MNEIEELRTIWQKRHRPDEQVVYNSKEIESIFQLRTKRLVQQIGIAMRVDAILMTITAIAFTLILMFLGGSGRILDSLIIFSTAVILFLFYRLKSRSIDHFSDGDMPVRERITAIISRMQQYIRLYLWFLPILSAGLYIILVVRLSYWKLGAFVLDLTSVISLVPAVGVAVAIYVLTRWLAKTVFGNSLRELMQSLNDLDNLQD